MLLSCILCKEVCSIAVAFIVCSELGDTTHLTITATPATDPDTAKPTSPLMLLLNKIAEGVIVHLEIEKDFECVTADSEQILFRE
jgi:hypothetical protein